MKEWTREEKYRPLRNPQELLPLYEKIKMSEYRQIFHIQSVTGLMNDPNGFVWYDNEWHLFYQWCPWGAVHGLKHWYHIVSADLVTWRNIGLCLIPDRGDGYDNKGAYSGSAMPIDDKIYLYYTGNHRDEDWTRRSYTCLARLSKDGWVDKYPLPLFGEDPDHTDNQRDPKLICIPGSDTYYMILGAQTRDRRGCILVYSSEDIRRGWTCLGELKVPGFENFGDMWECPTLEHIGGKDVLVFCPQHLTIPGRGNSQHHNGYILGYMDWEKLTFFPEGQFHVLDFGFDSYAAACANNIQDNDKAILIAWMGLPDASYPTDEEDWAGCLTLPRELTVRGRRLIQKPLPEIRKLRDERLDTECNINGAFKLPRAAEIEIDCRKGAHSVRLFADENGEGGIHISCNADQTVISVDKSGMKQRFNVSDGEVRERPLENGLSHLRIFIDSSSIEIFVNDGDAVFTSRVFPLKDEHFCSVKGDSFTKMWSMKRAVREQFLV